MRQFYLLSKAGFLTTISGLVMAFLLGAFVIVTYQPALAGDSAVAADSVVAAEPQGQMNPMMGEAEKAKPEEPGKPCKEGQGGPPVLCVGVAISPVPNEFGCRTGQQCSLSTQNMPCGMAGANTYCRTKPISAGSTECKCKCDK